MGGYGIVQTRLSEVLEKKNALINRIIGYSNHDFFSLTSVES